MRASELLAGYYIAVMDQYTSATSVELLDSLDRSLQELAALQAIYEDGFESPDHSLRLVVKTTSEDMTRARACVEDGNTSLTTDDIPTLSLEVHLTFQTSDEGSTTSSKNDRSVTACIGFSIPPAYPAFQAVSVTVLTAKGLTKALQKELSQHLQSTATDLIGSEAIMVLVQVCQEQIENFVLETKQLQQTNSDSGDFATNDPSLSTTLSRRWIWVHHITNRQRKEDIVEEANNFQLGGYLKAGYPGVVVVEGNSKACDDFVTFIKGNKSRPGGFGRQWGHHVRGEVDIEQRQLPVKFVALEEDLSILASVCRDRELEGEFKRYVMQHG